jgi:hypothetical protein
VEKVEDLRSSLYVAELRHESYAAMAENHEEAGSVRPEVAQAVGIAAHATPDHAANLAAFLSAQARQGTDELLTPEMSMHRRGRRERKRFRGHMNSVGGWTKPIPISKSSTKKGKTFSALLPRKMGPPDGQFILCVKTRIAGYFKMDNAISHFKARSAHLDTPVQEGNSGKCGASTEREQCGSGAPRRRALRDPALVLIPDRRKINT